jgi:Fur family zinc uptake transcriptional regulator
LTDRMRSRNTTYVTDALKSATRPMSAYEIIAAIRPEAELAPTTVYRALRQLVSEGKVHRIESLNAFVACRQSRHAGPTHQDGQGVGFIICDTCGAVEEFIDPVIVERVAAARIAHGFSAAAMTLELRGLCASCSNNGLAP